MIHQKCGTDGGNVEERKVLELNEDSVVGIQLYSHCVLLHTCTLSVI